MEVRAARLKVCTIQARIQAASILRVFRAQEFLTPPLVRRIDGLDGSNSIAEPLLHGRVTYLV